jgi:hypothetical protein
MVQKHQIKALLERRDKLRELESKWEPHQKQKEVINAVKAGKKFIFVRAGRRSGKTFIAKYLASAVCGLSPNQTGSIITPSLKQGYKIYWKKRQLQNFVPKNWIIKEKNDDLTLFFGNGSYIEIDGSENIDAHRGDEKNIVVLDEYKDIDPRFFPEVVEPMLLTTDGIVLVIGTPPETPTSHFRDLEEHARSDPRWAVIHWSAYDSPYCSKEWLDAKREELTARGELDVFKREYLAEYTTGGKNSVFPMLSRSLHVKSIPTVSRYYQSIKDRVELYNVNDPATSSVFGSLFIGYRREAGQILFLDEIYGTDKNETHTGAVVETIKHKISPFESNLDKWSIVYDDAEAWFGNELLHEHNIVASPAGKAAVIKEEGFSLFKSLLLKKNSVIISEACENLIKELENYIMLNGKYPLSGDHLIDCVRYFLNYAQVIMSLAENGDLKDDDSDYLYMPDDLGLGSGWIQ